MCGRFAQSIPLGKLNKIDLFDEIAGTYAESYNLAPSQNGSVVCIKDGKRVLKQMKWGLIPSWTKPDKAGSGLINARFDTITEKPSFRSSYKHKRCIIPVTGFYEWRKEGKQKVPFFINCGRDSGGDFIPMLLCGLFDNWISPHGEEIETFTIITTGSSAGMTSIHDRMPLILDQKNIMLWLGEEYSHDQHQDAIRSFNAGSLDIYRVSDFVNSYANNTPQCIMPTEV
jgi:putative SOS response-associated peptidase YedK